MHVLSKCKTRLFRDFRDSCLGETQIKELFDDADDGISRHEKRFFDSDASD